jgi:hypothetical protein
MPPLTPLKSTVWNARFFDILVAAAKIEYLTPEHQCSIDAKPGLHRDNLEIRRTKSVS